MYRGQASRRGAWCEVPSMPAVNTASSPPHDPVPLLHLSGDDVTMERPHHEEGDEDMTTTPAVPDGGWGWVVTAATTLMFLLISSLLNSFSVMYAAYTEYFNQSIGMIGMIIAVQIACLHLTGALGGYFVERYGCRLVAMTGFMTASSSIFVASFVTNVPQLCTAYAFAGCGLGVAYLCCVVVVQQYFNRHRVLASGISVSGFSLGTILMPPLTRWLLDIYDWRGTLIILSGLLLHGVLLSALLRPLPKSQRASATSQASCSETCRGIMDFSLLLDVRFLLYSIGTLTEALGIVAFLSHFVNRAIDIDIERHRATLLPLIFGGVNFVSRIIFGLIGNARNISRIVMYGVGILAAGICCGLSALAYDFTTLAIAAVCFGICSGCLASVEMPALVDLLGVGRITRSAAMLLLFNGVGGLTARPFAGWLYDITQDYRVPYYATGGIESIGGILIIIIPLVQTKLRRSSSSSQ